MKIGIGADHRGAEIAPKLADLLTRLGHEAACVGVCDGKACDYPDKAYPVAIAVVEGRFDRGILICGTGLGMCMAANKVKGVRAACAHDEIGADLSRRQLDTNVLCLSADMLGYRIIERIVQTWMTTPFEGGRHARRVQKITAIEQGHHPSSVSDPASAAE